MALPLVAFCSHYTESFPMGPDGKADNATRVWDAVKVVKAVKGAEVKGYAHMPVLGRERRFDSRNAASVFVWLGEWGAHQLEEREREVRWTAVPIPNSDAVKDSDETGPAHKLALAMAEKITGGVVMVADVFRWRTRLGKTHLGNGSRDPATLYPVLRMTQSLTARKRVVLVDDVMTTGGHLRAAAARLRSEDCYPVLALCVGRNTDDLPQNAFTMITEELEDFVPKK